MNIRKYIPTDRIQCIEIFKSNCPDFFDTSEIKWFVNWINCQDAEKTTYDNADKDFYYVFENDNKIIACGGFYVVKNKTTVHMAWGMVEKNYHRQGYGKKLFQYRLDQIKKLFPGYSILLDTSQHTYHFFEKFGFNIIEITSDGYEPGLHRYDMELK